MEASDSGEQLPHIRLIVQYDGSCFSGWQLQPGARTIQGVLEKAIGKVCGGRPIRLYVAGRTDAGAHARAQVASFRSPCKRPMRAWVEGLNKLLPDDLAVIEADEVPANFDPRRWAHSKRYVYRVWNGPTRSPLVCRHAWEVFQPLDLSVMSKAASLLVGEHDFASFQAAGCAAETTIRVMERLTVQGRPGAEVLIEAKASAFLRYMVRNIAGTLVDVGLHRRDPNGMIELLSARDRLLAGPTAPAKGLTLEEVYYEKDPPRRRRMVAGSGTWSAGSVNE